MKSVALFDFDNTLYDGFSYFQLLEKQVQEQLVDRSILDEALAIMKSYKNGEVNYETTVTRLLDAYAQGLTGKPYDAIYQSTVAYYQHTKKVYPFVKPVFELLRPTHTVCLVTAEPQFVAEALQELYGIDSYYASQYEVNDGIFTGKVTSYLDSRHEKHNAIRHLLEGHQLKGSFAFGDSEGDIEMLAAVENPICINATAGLHDKANQNDWASLKPEEVVSAVTVLLAK